MASISNLAGPLAASLLIWQALAPSSTDSARPQAATASPVTRVVRWNHGDTTKRLIAADRGFCFISGIGGNFEGGGEAVRVYVDDGIWWVSGHSQQPTLWVDVTCMEWVPGPNKPAGAPELRSAPDPTRPAAGRDKF